MIDLCLRYGPNRVPVLSNSEIDAHAESLIADYMPELLASPKPLDVDDFAENYLGLRFHYTYLSHKGFIWGRMVFRNSKIIVYNTETLRADEEPVDGGTVVIDNRLLDAKREHAYRSTVMHECGHGIYHRVYYQIDISQLSRGNIVLLDHLPYTSCEAKNIIGRSGALRTDLDWIEHQAKYFSAAILMPRASLVKISTEPYIRNWICENYPGNENEQLAKIIAKTFNVSVESAKIRISQLGLSCKSDIPSGKTYYSYQNFPSARKF